MKGINKVDNFKIKNLQNRSVDETAKGRFENLRDSSFDPISALSKLTFSAKNNNAQFLKRIDPVSWPISPIPNNKELWPRTLRNSKELISDFALSPKLLMNDYQKERKNDVLSISRLLSKQKPNNVWDAMTLHDVENFK